MDDMLGARRLVCQSVGLGVGERVGERFMFDENFLLMRSCDIPASSYSESEVDQSSYYPR